MSDARDQINLADWMERRKDALGPYGDHVLDGVRRYEALIAHHDDVVRELREALEAIARTDVWGQSLHHALNDRIKLARAALAKLETGHE